MPERVSTRIAGIGRATAASVAGSRPARRSATTAAGDVKTPPARQDQTGDRSRTTTSRPAAASRAARTAPAGPPPTIAIPTRSTGPSPRAPRLPVIRRPPVDRRRRPVLHLPGRRDGRDRVALAERATDRPHRRQAGAQQQRLGLDRPIRAQDRERSVGARVPVAGQEMADQPRRRSSPSRVRSRSLTTTPSRATRAISRSSTTASRADRWWITSEEWTTSNDPSP